MYRYIAYINLLCYNMFYMEKVPNLDHVSAKQRLFAAGVVVASLLSGCAGGDQKGSIGVAKVEPLSQEVSLPTESTSNYVGDRPADANTPAERITTPKVLDCSGVLIDVFGNSNDMDPNWIEPELTPYPTLLMNTLNFRPDVDNLTVVSHAYPGSTIVAPPPYGMSGDMTRLVTAVPTVLASYSHEQKDKTLVVLSPSSVSLYNHPEDIPAAVNAVATTVQYVKDSGVSVFVEPMDGMTDVAAFLTDIPDINKRAEAFNQGISELGLLSPNMMQSPLLDPETGLPNPVYYDDYKAPKGGPMEGNMDGLHYGNSGHTAKANALAALPEIEAFLQKACTAVTSR